MVDYRTIIPMGDSLVVVLLVVVGTIGAARLWDRFAPGPHK